MIKKFSNTKVVLVTTISPAKAISFCLAQSSIDNNKGKFGKDETKFYMISVNPSKDELRHIGKSASGRDIKNISQLIAIELKRYKEAIKDYTRKVMDDQYKAIQEKCNKLELKLKTTKEYLENILSHTENKYTGMERKPVINELKFYSH